MQRNKDQRIIIAVVGSQDKDPEVDLIAHRIGRIVSEVGAILICGGLGGVMELACKGARENGGTTLGLLPGKNKQEANPFVDIVLPTSLGFARNCVVACSADIIIALPGSHGTNSEICYGLIHGRPVIDLGNWNIEGMIKVNDLQEAEDKIRELVERIKKT
jgi:uncharacterized protein (TIGR00725 family)